MDPKTQKRQEDRNTEENEKPEESSIALADGFGQCKWQCPKIEDSQLVPP